MNTEKTSPGEIVRQASEIGELCNRLDRKMAERLMDPRNAAKGSWRTLTDDQMKRGYLQEITEVLEELGDIRPFHGLDDEQLDRIEHEIVDVCNFGAFILERIAEIRELRRVEEAIGDRR